MSAGSELALTVQRHAIREQLRTQRVKLAEQLAPGAVSQNHFPRSITLRLLIERPELLSQRNFRFALLAGVTALALLAPTAAYTADPQPAADAPATVTPPADPKGPHTDAPPAPALESKTQKAAPTAFAAAQPKPVLYWGIGDGKSYWIPGFEIIGFDFGLNEINRHFIDPDVYSSNMASLRENLNSKWIVDTDPFAVNQFLHPYQGSMYHNFARSAGQDYWHATGYTMFGSAIWEYAGEKTTPSINDQVASGLGGSLLGEPLFRISSLLLESGGGNPGFWRELGAAVISPSTGFNRLFFGERFKGVFRSNEPAVYTRVELGVSNAAKVTSNVPVTVNKRREVNADFTMGYGLPGKTGYTYERPFDYFHFEFTAATGNTFENIMSRGLLYGESYGFGDKYRGVWGLYGTYDYIAPQVFRVSTTGAALGTTGQAWLSHKVALQGTVLGGLGYGAAGTIRGDGIGGAASGGSGERDYHYGMTPQGMVALRFILGDRASFDTTVRDYYVTRYGATENGGTEQIFRADVSLTLRVYDLHGITLRYVESRRDASYALRAATHQDVGTFSIVYSFIGQTHFGAVDWRPKSAGGP